MDSNWLFPSIVISLLLFNWGTHVHCQTNIFPVVESDAELTDSKQAFLDAWKKACATNGGTMVIPKGTYLLSDAQFLGPCNGQTKFILDGTIIATDVPTPNINYWIFFRNLNSLSISGQGTLDGNGASYWKQKQTTILSSLKLAYVKNVKIQDIHSLNSKKFHMGIDNCQNVTINNIHITAPGNSPNTDGIHVGVSDNVRISNSNIATGDDCISLGDGSTNINITGITCGPGHGISIGSLGRYPAEKEVRSITVTNCTLTNTQNGARIKTFGPSTLGVASTITFQGIIVNNVTNPILIDQYYCPNSQCPGQGESSVSIKSVKFIDFHGSSGKPVGVKIACSKTNPCQDIELTGVKLTFNGQPTTATCSSADVKFNGPNQIPSRCT
ncbi:hypothetical protein C2S51_037625 [Perilla frutescens var. frutescens]|nr:hypothetical protein C2S51_037625 [Perilla frutescens var. frutescens]